MMLIERANLSDLRAILELQYEAYQSEAELLSDYSIPPLKQTYEEVKQEYQNGLFLKTVDENNVIIGSVRAHISNNSAYIGKLIVHPEKQGHGIGTKLLLSIEKECPVSRYELFTSNKRAKNIRLYERLGYSRFKEQTITKDFSFVYLEKYYAV